MATFGHALVLASNDRFLIISIQKQQHLESGTTQFTVCLASCADGTSFNELNISWGMLSNPVYSKFLKSKEYTDNHEKWS